MRIGRILFLAIGLFAVSVILGSSAFLEQQANNYAAKYQAAAPSAVMEKLVIKERYKRDLLEILSKNGSEKASYQELEKNLLALTVPTEYRDLHFKLVSVFGSLQGNPEAIKSAAEQLEKLQQTYIWLANKLTIFLIHNF